MGVLVEETDTYTVEFWFKPRFDEREKLAAQDITYLFMMEGNEDEQTGVASAVAKNVMKIVVEDDVLKCLPFGMASDSADYKDNLEFDELIYEGINPLEVDKWQHITCTYIKGRYVKGQYLAIDIEEDKDNSVWKPFYNADFDAETDITNGWDITGSIEAMNWDGKTDLERAIEINAKPFADDILRPQTFSKSIYKTPEAEITTPNSNN